MASLSFLDTRAGDILFVDVGGDRDIDALLRLLPIAVLRLAPRLIVVKSRTLFKSATEWRSEEACEDREEQPLARLGDAAAWWSAIVADGRLDAPAKRAKPYHGAEPRFAQYPLKYLPVAAPNGTLICRFHNYGVCKKSETTCSYDHDHCHYCRLPGHRAQQCVATDVCTAPLSDDAAIAISNARPQYS